MKTQIIKTLEYKNCPILARRIGCHFEFIVIFKNKIYSEYINVIPIWYKTFYTEPFSDKEIHDTAMILIGMAKGLIDKLKE